MYENETNARIAINSAIKSLTDEDGRAKTRELSLAVTKLQEAGMWITAHCRKVALDDSTDEMKEG